MSKFDQNAPMCNVMTGARIRRLFTTRRALNIVPPLSLLFGLDQKYNGQLIVQTIVKPMISVLSGHSKSIIEKFKAKPKVQRANCVQRLTLFIKRVLQKILKLLKSLTKLLQGSQQEFEISVFFLATGFKNFHASSRLQLSAKGLSG